MTRTRATPQELHPALPRSLLARAIAVRPLLGSLALVSIMTANAGESTIADLDIPAQAAAQAPLGGADQAGQPAGGGASVAQSREVPGARAVLDEIVVTAQRRESLLRETAISLTSLDSEMVTKHGINSVFDLDHLVPGLKIGREFSSAQITIRGIGNENVFMGADPGVAFHLDDVYIARSEATLAAFYDVERIEVLRGPQGTLYGRNSTGGAINVISKQPTTEFDAQIYGELGRFEQWGVGGFLSGPVYGDAMLGRLSFRVAQDDGYMHNIAPGQPDLGDQDLYSVRGQLKFNLTENLSLGIKADVHEDDNNGPGGKLLGTLTGGPSIPELFLGAIAARDEFSTASDIDSYYTTDLKGASATLEWELDDVKLTSISAYRDSSIENLFDADFTTFPHQYVLFDDTSEHFSQELRLASNGGGRVDWIVGAYYFEDESSQLVDTGVTHVPISFDPLMMFPFDASYGGDLDTTSHAFFGNATWKAIEDTLNLQAGVRYTRDEKEIDEFNAIEFGPFPPMGGTANQDESWSEVTYLAGVEYFPVEKTMLYVNASTGFKAGGFNSGALTPAFDPETALNFELGLKSRFLDDRADLSLAVFNTDYEDLQVAQVVNLTVMVDNAAQARLRGVELEGTVALTEAFHLSGSFAYLDAEFEEYQNLDQANPGAGVQDLEGRNLPNAPEITMSLVPEYTFDIADHGTLTIYGAYSYQSRDYLDQFNSRRFSQESVEIYDVGATYVPHNGAITVSVFGKNLTDEEVMNSLFVSGAITLSVGSASVSPARTYGVRIEYNF